MALKQYNEKCRDTSNTSPRKSGRVSHTSIVLCQHLLLWSSLFVAGGTIYIVSQGKLQTESFVAHALLLSAATTSILCLTLHQSAVLQRSSTKAFARDDKSTFWQRFSNNCLRLSVTAWLTADAIAIIFILAKYPRCRVSGLSSASPLDARSTCIVQRTVVGTSLLALIVSVILVILIHRAREPFRCDLFGVRAEQPVLPLKLPYKLSIDRPANPMFSEMSFKCRSFTTLSSTTLNPAFDESTASLLPKQPEKAVGLGIYTSRSSMPAFLAPRPSLSSIRSHASIHLPPPTSPLPPLPAYLPDRYDIGSAMHKAIHPPQRPQPPIRIPSQHTVRLVPPSPALSMANLAAFNKSAESLSSVYSRSISGERYTPRTLQRPGPPTAESRTVSSSSTITIKRSPLGIMRLASDPDIIVGEHDGDRRSSNVSSDSDIDDAATLQARLPLVKTVSDFGEVSNWPSSGRDEDVATKCYQKSYEICLGEMKKVDFTPLNVRRTRDSAGMFCPGTVGLAT